MRRIVANLTLTSLLLAAGSSVAQQSTPETPQFQLPPQSQNSLADAAKQEVIATVNGQAITKPEFEASVEQRLGELQRSAQTQGQPLGEDVVQRVKQDTLDTLIESRLVEQYVTEQGPTVEKQEIDSAIEGVKQQLSTQQVPFEKFLEMRGHTEESFEQRIEGSLAWQKFQQQQVSAEKLKQFFEANKEAFQAESFEQAQQQVVQSYVATLWSDIVRAMKPNAEIKLAGSASSPMSGGQGPAGVTPGGSEAR